MCKLWVLLFVFFSNSVLAQVSAKAELVMTVTREGVDKVTINVTSNVNGPLIVAVPVPFIAVKVESGQAALWHHRSERAVLVLLPDGVNTADVIVTAGKQHSIHSPVDIRQVASGTFMTVEPSQSSDLKALQPLHTAGKVVFVDGVPGVSAEFPGGVTIVEKFVERKISSRHVERLILDQSSNTYGLAFRIPAEKWEVTAGTIVKRLFVVAIAIMLTLAAPDIVPARYQFWLLIGVGTIVTLVLATRWILAFRDRTQIDGAISDTVAAVLYGASIAVITLLRHRRSGAS